MPMRSISLCSNSGKLGNGAAAAEQAPRPGADPDIAAAHALQDPSGGGPDIAAAHAEFTTYSVADALGGGVGIATAHAEFRTCASVADALGGGVGPSPSAAGSTRRGGGVAGGLSSSPPWSPPETSPMSTGRRRHKSRRGCIATPKVGKEWGAGAPRARRRKFEPRV